MTESVISPQPHGLRIVVGQQQRAAGAYLENNLAISGSSLGQG
jgi:hypothetical protein